MAAASNYGINGSRIASQPGDKDTAMSVRYVQMDEDADLVIVFGGTNDFKNNVTINTDNQGKICA